MCDNERNETWDAEKCNDNNNKSCNLVCVWKYACDVMENRQDSRVSSDDVEKWGCRNHGSCNLKWELQSIIM